MIDSYLLQNDFICLMGATASGKSALALKWAKAYDLEIISVDSAMVYRGLDIGSAKPSKEELNCVPHHLIDIKDPKEIYSAADFAIDAKNLIAEILARDKKPILVGGTMLYFKALLHGLSDLPSADPLTREQLQKEAEKEGWEALHQKLQSIDPVSANRIHPNDPQRLQRALEVYYLTGKTLTSFHEKQKAAFPYRYQVFAIEAKDRALLHQKIEQRFDQMLEEGFLDEVKALFDRGDLTIDLPAIRSVGYRQAWEYLQGQITLDQMREKAIAATRQLAKRQLTWLRSWPDLVFILTPPSSSSQK